MRARSVFMFVAVLLQGLEVGVAMHLPTSFEEEAIEEAAAAKKAQPQSAKKSTGLKHAFQVMSDQSAFVDLSARERRKGVKLQHHTDKAASEEKKHKKNLLEQHSEKHDKKVGDRTSDDAGKHEHARHNHTASHGSKTSAGHHSKVHGASKHNSTLKTSSEQGSHDVVEESAVAAAAAAVHAKHGSAISAAAAHRRHSKGATISDRAADEITVADESTEDVDSVHHAAHQSAAAASAHTKHSQGATSSHHTAHDHHAKHAKGATTTHHGHKASHQHHASSKGVLEQVFSFLWTVVYKLLHASMATCFVLAFMVVVCLVNFKAEKLTSGKEASISRPLCYEVLTSRKLKKYAAAGVKRQLY